MKKNFFLSVDWGTTNFRLRLLKKSPFHVIKEIISPIGVKLLYDKWQQEGGDREGIFLNFLKRQVGQLQCDIPLDIEIVISGMASSNIGICELPYVSLPFSMAGKNAFIKLIKHCLFPQGLQLISGVCSDCDVIRGEETQMIGLAGKEHRYGRSIFILPGTHSKHIVCEDGNITAFNTFMTGELFQVICTHTILNNSIVLSGRRGWKAFGEGVLRAGESASLLKDLFEIRAGYILNKRSKEENYHYLSGLLIGQEIAALKSVPFDQIQLCAGNNLHKLYKSAIEIMGLQGRTTVISRKMVETSVAKGHLILLNRR